MDIKERYLPFSLLKRFEERVERTKQNIKEKLAGFKKIGVSFSTGKDSLVMLDLIISTVPKEMIEIIFFDSGGEYPDTLKSIEIIENHFKKEILVIEPQLTIKEIAKIQGIFGYKGEEYDGNVYSSDEVKSILIREPALLATAELGLEVQCVGLRKQESGAREILLKRGDLQKFSYSPIPIFYPIANWTGAEIWAYIAKHDLPYNDIYNKLNMTAGQDPEVARVGSYMGEVNLNRGRISFLKYYYPEIYNKLLPDFPDLKNYV